MSKKGFQNFDMSWLAKHHPEQAQEIFSRKAPPDTRKDATGEEKGKKSKYFVIGLNGTYTISIKPLSVNEAWKGKRYKSKKYDKYEELLLSWLPEIEIPSVPIRIIYEFGFSNRASDIDNPVKLFTDVLQKKYDFDDKDVYEMNIKKVIVAKKSEYVKFKIESIQEV